jgi:hypothetical protein
MLVMLKVALPVLLRVTVCAALVASTVWLPKERLVAERLATGPLPVEAGTAPLLPAPQEVVKNASAMQAVARIAVFTRCRCSLVSIQDAWLARVLPISARVLSLHACPRKADHLRATNDGVRDGDCSASSSGRGGRKGYTDRAIVSPRDACPTIVFLSKSPLAATQEIASPALQLWST